MFKISLSREINKDCLVVFILIYVRSWQGRVSKVINTDHFLVFLAVWYFSSGFWAG